MISKSVALKAQFYDVDSMNVVWHGNYVKYFETARCTLLEEIGYDYEAMRADGYAYPIVKIEAKYIKPVFFGDEIEVEATLKECECFLKIGYVVKSAKTGETLCTGTSSQAAVDMRAMQTCFEIPQELQNAIKRYINEKNSDNF